jgi:addiction module HigA family antidote
MINGGSVLSGKMETLLRSKLTITTRFMNTKLPPIHPGEVLLEDFMKPMKLSAYRVAKDIGTTPIAIIQITRGRRTVTAQTALLLAKYFGTSPEVWIRLQAQYDLEVTREKISDRLAKVSLASAA